MSYILPSHNEISDTPPSMSDLMSDDVCRHGVHQNVEALRGRTVKLYQDNMTVVGTLHKMSFKYPELMVEIKNLIP